MKNMELVLCMLVIASILLLLAFRSERAKEEEIKLLENTINKLEAKTKHLNQMKYLFIYYYFEQSCPNKKQKFGYPPYYYLVAFDTFEKADNYRMDFEKSKIGRGDIVYGYPTFYTKEDLRQ